MDEGRDLLQQTATIEAFCAAQGVAVVERIPYDLVVTEAMVQGQPVTAYQSQGPVAAALGQVWTEVRKRLSETERF